MYCPTNFHMYCFVYEPSGALIFFAMTHSRLAFNDELVTLSLKGFGTL